MILSDKLLVLDKIMNNYSLEPKDGDFVALVKQLEKKNVAAIKNDIVKSNANHQAHIQKEAINIQPARARPRW